MSGLGGWCVWLERSECGESMTECGLVAAAALLRTSQHILFPGERIELTGTGTTCPGAVFLHRLCLTCTP